MSSFLAKAKARFSTSQYEYRLIGNDDAYLDTCCYDLQQSLEFALKYIVSVNGGDYVENHDIRAQLNRLNKMGIKLSEEKRIRELAPEINSWEAESRYSQNFVATIAMIDEVMDIVSRVIDYASGIVVEAEEGLLSIPASRIKQQ